MADCFEGDFVFLDECFSDFYFSSVVDFLLGRRVLRGAGKFEERVSVFVNDEDCCWAFEKSLNLFRESDFSCREGLEVFREGYFEMRRNFFGLRS